jgi:hypothetical protein
MRKGKGRKGKGELNVGDRVRIVSVPCVGVSGYYLHRDTKRAYKILIERRRPVRIDRIDDDGLPWFRFRVKQKNGTWEHHFMCIAPGDNNWVMVKQTPRTTAAGSTRGDE